MVVVEEDRFTTLAGDPGAPLDRLALALAAEFRPVDAGAALAALDALGADLAAAVPAGAGPDAEVRACAEVLGERHGFRGDRERYDAPENSMLDLVLERRRGLPILLSAVYVEAARRAGIALAGVGLPGHFVVGHFGARPPLLLDPFAGGEALPAPPASPAASGRGARTRPSCACSTTSSAATRGARTSAPPCAPRSCGSRCPPRAPRGSR